MAKGIFIMLLKCIEDRRIMKYPRLKRMQATCLVRNTEERKVYDHPLSM